MADGILETVTAVVAMSNTSTVPADQRDVTSTVAAAASVPIFRPEQPGTRLLRISYYNPNDEPVISEHPVRIEPLFLPSQLSYDPII